MASFSDSFTRSNRDLNGDNGWACSSSGQWSIISNVAISATGNPYLSQNLGTQLFPITLSYTLKHSGTGSRYLNYSYIGAGTTSNYTTTSINVYLYRADSSYNNSKFELYDGATLVSTTNASTQFSGDITVVLNIIANGSGTLVVNGQSASFGARSWVNGVGSLLVFDANTGNDGLGQTNTSGIDDLVYTYKLQSNPAFLLNFT